MVPDLATHRYDLGDLATRRYAVVVGICGYFGTGGVPMSRKDDPRRARAAADRVRACGPAWRRSTWRGIGAAVHLAAGAMGGDPLAAGAMGGGPPGGGPASRRSTWRRGQRAASGLAAGQIGRRSSLGK